MTSLLAADSGLDEFLEGAGSATTLGERVEAIGFGVSLAGILVAVGALFLLLTIFRAERDEVSQLVRFVAALGALLAGGAVLELVGTVMIVNTGLGEVLSSGGAMAPWMRFGAGALVLVGARLDRADVQVFDSAHTTAWLPGTAASVAVVGAVIGILSFSFDGHTVSEGPRFAHAALNVVHLTAGGVWAGGVLVLAIRGWRRHFTQRGGFVSPLVVRFSGVAAWALLAVVLAGAGMAVLILESPESLFRTAWGRSLLAKTTVVVLAAGIGTYNHFAIVPTLERVPDDEEVATRSRRLLSVEAVLLVIVMGLSVILSGSSTN